MFMKTVIDENQSIAGVGFRSTVLLMGTKV